MERVCMATVTTQFGFSALQINQFEENLCLSGRRTLNKTTRHDLLSLGDISTHDVIFRGDFIGHPSVIRTRTRGAKALYDYCFLCDGTIISLYYKDDIATEEEVAEHKGIQLVKAEHETAVKSERDTLDALKKIDWDSMPATIGPCRLSPYYTENGGSH